jgi:hypothetical protein
MTGVDLDPTISTYLVLGEVGTRQKEESVKSYPQNQGLPVFGDLDLAKGECHHF